MAGVATTSKMLFLSWLVAFFLGVGATLWAAQPYMCDRKIDPRRPTLCHSRQILPSTR